MRPFFQILLLALAVRGAHAAVYVVPVATAKYHDRYYTTTLSLQNQSNDPVRCEAIYAIPNNPKGGTLRGTYELAPHTTQVERDVLREAGAIGTLQLACTDQIALSARIQTSTDGVTFGNDRVFHGIGEDDPIRTGIPRQIQAARSVVIMEVLGEDAEVHAVLRDANGRSLAKHTYPLPAFAQQIISPTDQTASIEFVVTGAGGGVVQVEGERRRVANVRVASVNTSPGPLLNGLPASFKAAPFREPLTGLVMLRDRWYDPKTGTFMSPDPEGYADSPNQYLFGKGDPVNSGDPTGRHTFVKRQVGGIEFELLAPDADEVRKGILGMSGSFVNPYTGKRETFSWDQHESELLLMQARWGNPIMQDAFAQFFGITHDQVNVSGLRLYWNSLWHHKVDIALSAGFTITMLAPRPPVAAPRVSSTPRVNLVNPTTLGSRLARTAGIPESAAFAQTTYSPAFSAEGRFAGMTVDEVTAGLRAGRLTSADVRVDYIVRDGNTLILNTRSAQALQNAGIARNLWVGVDRTGVAQYEAMVTSQLNRNRLTSTGTPTVRPAAPRKP